MFVFLFILLLKIIFALPTIEHASITDTEIVETTSVPSNLMNNVEKSSNELQKAVNSLQTAIRILFPKKNHQEKNLLIDRQSPLIRCLFSKVRFSEEEKKLCQDIYGKTSDDDLSKEENTLDDNDDSAVESNEEMPKESSVLNNVFNRKRIMLDTVSKSPLTQYWFNRSRSPQTNLDTINLNRKQSDYDGSILQRLSNFHPIKKTVKKLLDMKNMAQSNENESTDRNLNLIRDKTRIYQQQSPEKQEENSSSHLLGENQNEFDINTQNENTEKQQTKTSTNLLNLDRTLDNSIQKHIVLANLSKTLGTLESIMETNDLDFMNNKQALLKPSDLISLIKSKKFSWKFLQFLNTIKNTLDQSIAYNKTNSIN